MNTRRQILHLAGGLGLASLPLSGLTQAWPTKPVRLVVPSAAGSPWDPVARHLADRLSKVFGQAFVVENRSGGVCLQMV